MNFTVLICSKITFALQHFAETVYAKFHPHQL